MDGHEMCKLGKEEFLDRTPGCVGDILYEHLQLLQIDAERNENESSSETSSANNRSTNNNFKGEIGRDISLQQQQQQGTVLYEELQLLQQTSNHELVSFKLFFFFLNFARWRFE